MKVKAGQEGLSHGRISLLLVTHPWSQQKTVPPRLPFRVGLRRYNGKAVERGFSELAAGQ